MVWMRVRWAGRKVDVAVREVAVLEGDVNDLWVPLAGERTK
jgi:hypothetical protein